MLQSELQAAQEALAARGLELQAAVADAEEVTASLRTQLADANAALSARTQDLAAVVVTAGAAASEAQSTIASLRQQLEAAGATGTAASQRCAALEHDVATLRGRCQELEQCQMQTPSGEAPAVASVATRESATEVNDGGAAERAALEPAAVVSATAQLSEELQASRASLAEAQDLLAARSKELEAAQVAVDRESWKVSELSEAVEQLQQARVS
jgi:hypothetical protein